MQTIQNKKLNYAIVISGIKLILDLGTFNLASLELLLANMQFFLTKYLPEHAIALYTSEFYAEDLSTLIFLEPGGTIIKKVRYVDCKLENFFFT